MAQDWTAKNQFNNRKQEPRLEDLIGMVKFEPNTFYRARFLGPMFRYAEHWIKIRKKDGGTANIRKLCLSFDPESGEFSKPCPYCKNCESTPRISVLQNAIIRAEQKREPRKLPKPTSSEMKEVKVWAGKKLFRLKSKDSETWTPVGVTRFPSSAAQRIADISALNVKQKKDGSNVAYGPDHEKYGFDIMIKHDPNAAPANQYFIQKEARSPLTDVELAYLIWKLDSEKRETFETAEKEAANMMKRLIVKRDGKEVDLNAGVGNEEKGSKSSKKKDKYARNNNNDDDVDLEDLKSSKKADKKKKKKKKKKSSDSLGF